MPPAKLSASQLRRFKRSPKITVFGCSNSPLTSTWLLIAVHFSPEIRYHAARNSTLGPLLFPGMPSPPLPLTFMEPRIPESAIVFVFEWMNDGGHVGSASLTRIRDWNVQFCQNVWHLACQLRIEMLAWRMELEIKSIRLNKELREREAVAVMQAATRRTALVPRYEFGDCLLCNNDGHEAEECDSRVKAKDRCRRCWRKGHWVSDCKVRMLNDKKQEYETSKTMTPAKVMGVTILPTITE